MSRSRNYQSTIRIIEHHRGMTLIVKHGLFVYYLYLSRDGSPYSEVICYRNQRAGKDYCIEIDHVEGTVSRIVCGRECLVVAYEPHDSPRGRELLHDADSAIDFLLNTVAQVVKSCQQ